MASVKARGCNRGLDSGGCGPSSVQGQSPGQRVRGEDHLSWKYFSFYMQKLGSCEGFLEFGHIIISRLHHCQKKSLISQWNQSLYCRWNAWLDTGRNKLSFKVENLFAWSRLQLMIRVKHQWCHYLKVPLVINTMHLPTAAKPWNGGAWPDCSLRSASALIQTHLYLYYTPSQQKALQFVHSLFYRFVPYERAT